MAVLEVKGLTKIYPTFTLSNVNFALAEGKITGFIGRNGAGKSTTLNSLFNFVHKDKGDITFWGQNVDDHEIEIKQKVGFVSSGINYYQNKKLKNITAVTKTFYPSWDESAYNKYMTAFGLDENKTPKQLSMGMKIKYAIVLALSHNAELLILDEPTSGLDPVSREELLDIFMDLSEQGKTILFSTHITSDLEKCADNIIYIKNGKVLADLDLDTFVNSYKVVEYEKGQLDKNQEALLIGAKRSKKGMSALVKIEDAQKLNCNVNDADLEAIMVHLERGE